MPKLQTPGLLGFVASGEPETPHSICPTEISNGSPSQPLRRGTVRAHRKSALENPRCSTDLMASASQNHRPGITLSTHRRSSVSSASRGRSTSNHHRPKADSVPHPSPDLTTPASWDYRIGSDKKQRHHRLDHQLSREREDEPLVGHQSTLATPCSCGCSFEQALRQNHNHSGAIKHRRCYETRNMPADGQPPCVISLMTSASRNHRTE
jgi:hypothetical protein